MPIERTLVLLKPDAVQRQLCGRVLQRFEDAGLKIAGMKMVQIGSDFAKKHYAAHVAKSFYPMLEKAISEAPLIAMVLEGLDAVEVVRKLVGETQPKNALPGTIRGDFAHQSSEVSAISGRAIKNLVHASGNRQEAEQEIALWFSKPELHDYKTASEVHTL